MSKTDIQNNKNKTVVISGSTSGLGKEMSIEFAKRGWVVAGFGKTKSKVDEMTKIMGVKHQIKECDVSCNKSVKSFSENIIWLYWDKRIIFRQKLELNIKKLTKFSIIPLSDLTNLSIDGAEWNLDNKNIQFGETLTLRNVTNEEQLNIRCDKGVFALIY